MHGLGNDFVILDGRKDRIILTSEEVCAISDRRRGVGCDQLITLESSERANAFMRIHNADGGEVAACGNAARCVADRLMNELGAEYASLETAAGILKATRDGHGMVTVDQGLARIEWHEIPLAQEIDTLHINLSTGAQPASELNDAVAVNVGNPHAVFFVDDATSVDLASIGPGLENHNLFPERANISVAQVLTPHSLRVRVWERGVGITAACGTAACAVAVASARRGLTERSVEIELDGGSLQIVWCDDGHAFMTGPVATSFVGTLDSALLNGQML